MMTTTTTPPGTSRRHGVALLRRGQERAAAVALADPPAAARSSPTRRYGRPAAIVQRHAGNPIPWARCSTNRRAEVAPRAARREWVGLAVLVLPTLLLSLDVSVLCLALPRLAADLQGRMTEVPMRKVVLAEHVSLDGVMEDPGGAKPSKHGGWMIPFWNDELQEPEWNASRIEGVGRRPGRFALAAKGWVALGAPPVPRSTGTRSPVPTQQKEGPR